MHLRDWIEKTKKTRSAVANDLGISGAHITRLCEHPDEFDASPELARKIVAYTEGEVSLNDLYLRT